MKKRILAAALACLMLAGMPAAPVYAHSEDAVWSQDSEYFNGGELQYGVAELRSGSAYATVHFAYGSEVSVSETAMQSIAGVLAENGSPMVNLPYDSASDKQNFLVLRCDNTESLNSLITALDRHEITAESVSDSDAVTSASDAEEVIQLTEQDIEKLHELFGLFGFGDNEVSDSDVISDSNTVSESHVSAADDVISDTDAVSDGDVASDSDAEPLTDEDVADMMELLGMFGFYNKTVSDTDVLSGSNVVSSVDVASDADAQPEDDSAEEEPETVPEDTPEESPEEIPEETEDTEEGSGETTEDTFTAAERDAAIATLTALLDGAVELEAMPTLEESLENAFPGFAFGEARPVAMIGSADPSVTMSEDYTSAQVVIAAQPEYVDIELNGTVFTVLMLNQKSTSCTVERVWINGSTDGLAEETVTTTTSAPTTTTTSATTTTTTTTQTTTTTTIAITTTEATTTSTTTTTTTAPTTTTTTTVSSNDFGEKMGYVNTRSLDLRVRRGPGLGFAVITCIPKGTVLTVIGAPDEEWYQVRLEDGTEGYVYSYYITLYS